MAMNLAIRQLRIFVALARSLNFGQTAAAFRLTQPRLSVLVAELETTLGVRLFDRNTRRVSITPEGQALLATATTMLDDFDGGLARLETIVRQQACVLSVAALPTYAAVLLPEVIGSLRRIEPDVSVAVHDALSGAAIEMLRARTVDMAIASIEALPADLRSEPFGRETLVLVGTDALLTEYGIGPSFTWSADAIGRIPVVSLSRGSSTFETIDRRISDEGRTFRPAYAFGNLVTIAAFIRSGLGIGLLPRLGSLLLNDDALRQVELVDGPSRPVGIVSRTGDAHSPLERRFVKALRQSWRRHGMPRST